MQIVDFWVGIPLCFLLSLLNTLLELISPAKKIDPKKIVLIELSEMGSAILAYSAIRKAQELVGQKNVFFLIFHRNRESVELLSAIPKENIIGIKDKNFLVFFFSTIHALWKMRSLRIDTSVDMETFSRCTALLAFLSGAKIRVGFDNFTEEGLYRGNFINRRVLYNPTQHMSLNFLALIQAIKADHSDLPLLKENVSKYLVSLPPYRPSPEELSKIRNLLNAAAIDSSKQLIILNPDPGLLKLRGWPLENFAAIVKKLSESFDNLTFLVVGLPQSRIFYENLVTLSGVKNILDFTGKTDNLAELVTLFSLANILLTNDSGPAHMASLTAIHNFTLYGPETPLRYAPLGQNSKSFFAGLACSPCYSAANHRHSICTNNVCMQAITVQKVENEIRKVIEC